MDSTDERTCLVEKSPPDQGVIKHKGFGTRHSLIILTFIGYFFAYALRYAFSIAIVAMTNSTRDTTKGNESAGQYPDLYNSTTTASRIGEYDWDEERQGILLSAFFYGYIITQIPGGYLADIVGGKHLFGGGIALTGLVSIFIPYLADASYMALLVARVVQGVASGVTFPALTAMLGKWIPKYERTFLPAVVITGAVVGNIICLPLAGFLCDHGPFGGWPSMFYIFGGATCLWYSFWLCLSHESPADHPRISTTERTYIETSVGARQKLRTPWKAILTSPAVIGLSITGFCESWGSFTIMTSVPTYLSRILKYDMTQNGMLMSIVNIFSALGCLSSGFITDFVRERQLLSTAFIRKLTLATGLMLAAVAFILIIFSGCNHTFNVILLTSAFAFDGYGGVSICANVYDIGHNYAGMVMGIVNFSGNLAGVVTPYVAGHITDNQQTMERWHIVFYLAAGMFTLSSVVFLITGRGSESWNVIDHNNATITVNVNDDSPTNEINKDDTTLLHVQN